MLSAHPRTAVPADLRPNALADGLFHLAAYVVTIAGASLVWRAGDATTPPSGRSLLGGGLVG